MELVIEPNLDTRVLEKHFVLSEMNKSLDSINAALVQDSFVCLRNQLHIGYMGELPFHLYAFLTSWLQVGGKLLSTNQYFVTATGSLQTFDTFFRSNFVETNNEQNLYLVKYMMEQWKNRRYHKLFPSIKNDFFTGPTRLITHQRFHNKGESG